MMEYSDRKGRAVLRWTALAMTLAVSAVAPARAADIWLIGGVPVANQAPPWQGIRADAAVWFSPVGSSPDILDLFGKPELWSIARLHVNVFKFEPFQVDAKKADSPTAFQSLKGLDAFGKLKKWGIATAIEVPAVKEWDCSGSGDTKDPRVRGDAKTTTLGYVRNVFDAGGMVQFLAMDEPLVNGLGACKGTLEETAEKTAKYAKAVLEYKEVKTWAPTLAIGDVEPYPSRSVAQLKLWTKTLESNGFKPSFFHLDVDVNDVDIRKPRFDVVADLRELKSFFQSEGIPFGIIFWSGHDPENSDASYYRHTMSWVNRVHSVIGKPEQSIFQSWVRRSSINCAGNVSCNAKNNYLCSSADPVYCGRGSMPINLPENDPTVFSHTRLINDALSVLGQAVGTAPLKKLVINAPTADELNQMIAEEGQWKDARAAVGSLLLSEGNIKRLPNPGLAAFNKKIKALGISLELEVGAVKEWAHEGEKAFILQKHWWDRITAQGGEIGAFAMDGPRENALKTLHLSEDFALEQVVQFIANVRRTYPQALVGDIEPYPSSTTEEHNDWIDRLEQRLHELNVRGLDFYRVDVNWVAFKGGKQGSWAGLKAIEDHCHAKKVPFSLIYWASDYPVDAAAGRLSDKTWYDGIMKAGRAYAETGAAPDQFVIESWIGWPKQALPESAAYTFTNSVRDFTHNFVH